MCLSIAEVVVLSPTRHIFIFTVSTPSPSSSEGLLNLLWLERQNIYKYYLLNVEWDQVSQTVSFLEPLNDVTKIL